MSEENLSDLLERSADRHNVGSPPLDQLLARSRRARKRRASFMTLAAAVLIGAVIAGTTLLFTPGDSASPADSPAGGVVNLEGGWVLTSLNDAGGKALPVESDKGEVRLSFDNGEAALRGCSSTTYSYEQTGELGQDLALRRATESGIFGCVEPPLADRMEEVRHVRESADVLSLLAADRSVIATFERVAPLEPINVTGEWVLTALTDAEGDGLSTRSDNDTKVTLSFSDGRLSVDLGCNSFLADYKSGGIDGRDLAFLNFGGMRGVACGQPPLYERLPDVRHVSEDGNKLQLHAEHWMIIAVLERDTPAPESTRTPASSQNPPRRMNMQVVRQFGGAQEYRAYSGPSTPPTTESEAIASVQGNEVYSLGLHDIGFVHYSGSIEWHSVWIIASDRFVPDVDSGLGGGPYRGPSQPNANPTPMEPRPGWARSVTMIDVTTGKVLMGLAF